MDVDRIGKYRIVGRIGKGAMGEVFKAEDPLLNRFVAVKTIAPALAAEDDFRRRFQREAQSAAALNHPNIVTIFDFGEADGLVYMAMEYLDGRDLRDLVHSPGLGLRDKLSIIEQICDGVGFAHSKGIVHRDIKPGNIHVLADGHVKILDFGLARLGDSVITRTGTVMGTPSYMSPEQVRGDKVDARSDVFSLGAVLYELLSGDRPFDANDSHEVRVRIVTQPPEPLARRVPDLPPALVAVVEKALVKDAAGRFADGSAMRRALADAREAIESELPGLATELPPAQPTDATVIRSSPGRPSVLGATALAPAAAVRSQPPTHRPDATVSAGGPATSLPASTHRPWTLVLGGAGLALLGVAVAAAMWFRFAGGVQPARVGGGQEQASTVADLFVANQIELARGDVADGEYERAAGRAEEALKLNPASAEARQLRDQARQALRRIDEAVTEARTAFARGDVTAASQALGRVMALAPRHPVVAELSAALKQHFRPQADDARLLADAARKRAEGARATSSADYERGRQLATDADASFRGEDYASAAQRYLESRIAFERARRLAEDARAAATSSPAVNRVAPPTTVASAPAASAPIVAPPPSVAAPPVAAAATGGPAPAPTTSAAPAARSAPSDSAEAEVRRVIAEYGRAIGSHDLALFRTVKPNLTTDEEKRLREAFKAVKSQAVGINVESVQIEGDRALVRATRQDTVDGRTMSPIPQAFHLARSGGSWAIQSIGQ